MNRFMTWLMFTQTAFAAVLLILPAVLLTTPMRAAGKINVVAATTDFAALATEVGGDKVEVQSIARGYQDPHFVEAKPSFLLRLYKADLLVVVGLDLEIGWLPPLITQSGNPKIQVGAPGYFDSSRYAEILDKSSGPITRAEGDVHPFGNPHYWLDPDNGRRVAKGLADKFAKMRPSDEAYFQQRYSDFDKRMVEAEKAWDAAMQPYSGRKVVTYHRSWTNLAKRYGLDVVGYVEPRPGIPPSPSHTLALIQQMKREKVKVILVEPYFDLKTPNSIASQTGAMVVVLMPSVGGDKSITDYFKLFEYDVKLLLNVLKATT